MLLAKHYDIGFTIDAEETERLELSLDIMEQLALDPATLRGGRFRARGVGAPETRAGAYRLACRARASQPPAADGAAGEGRPTRDSEIKRAQVDGHPGYPVFTRKVHTDVSYLPCAEKLLAAPGAFFPQFATHNAHTVAAIHSLAVPASYHPRQYEFQCLHGMGEPLHGGVRTRPADGRSCRIYAPVGSHEMLLAYLARRLC